MTQPPTPTFCGSCGSPVAATQTVFCTECGARLTPAQPTAPAAAGPYPAPPTPSPYPAVGLPQPTPMTYAPVPAAERAVGRHGKLVFGTVLALVLVGAAATTAAVVLGSDEEIVGPQGNRLVEAVDSAPERAWDYDLGYDQYLGAVVAGDGRVFVSGSEGVAALDADDGTELWRYREGYPTSVSPDGDHLLLTEVESEGVTSLASQDGSMEWQFDSGYSAYYTGDDVLVLGNGIVTLLDAATGEEVWDVASDFYSPGEDTLYAVAEGRLRAIDLDDGRERWSQSVGYSESVSLYPVDGMVVVQVETTVTAYDSGDGTQLWSNNEYAEYVSVEPIGSGAVAVMLQEYDQDVSTTRATVYDTSGEVGVIDVVDGYLGATLLNSGGETYAVTADGRVLDEERNVVARYDGYIVPVEGGAYVGDDFGDVSFYRVPDEEPAWTKALGVSTESESYLVPLDGGLAVVEGTRMTVYN